MGIAWGIPVLAVAVAAGLYLAFWMGRRASGTAVSESCDDDSRFFSLALDLFCIADTEGRFRKLNKAWETTLGYTLEDLEGKVFLDFVHADDLEGTLKALRILKEQKEVLNFVNRYRCKDGSYRWIEWRSCPAGELIYAAARDITASKLADEAARQIQKSESLSLMASGIAHDFNNLFQSIQGNLEVVLANPGDLGKVRISLERALRIVGEAASLSRKILDYSGRGFRRSVPVNLGILLSTRMEQLKLFAGTRTPFHFQIADNLPPVKGDPDQILQVLTGLIANAGEAMEAGVGEIRLSAAVVHLSEEDLLGPGWVEHPPQGDVVELKVSDSGKGIAPEHLGRIFDPFFSTKAAGRGLGLSAAIGIIRNHHGGLQVLSTPSGSTFRICFESVDQEEACEGPVTTDMAVPVGKTILLVDDDPDLREVTAESLHDILGYQVLVARDGAEAVEVFRDHADSISLVLMDAIMPRLPGSKAFDAIKKIRPEARAILCSGYGDEVGIEAVDQHGFLSFLKKPFSIKELSEAIEKALGQP
jgi:two-component system, cell cycle sensor histidine kinase and response regulator CckA